MKLLLIDDSSEICTALSRALYTDYDVDIAPTGQIGLNKALTNDYSLIILDLNLPDMNGLEVCQTLRYQNVSIPILILSAETKVLSKINLLDAGADDYLTKPFSLGELKVRLRTLLRHSVTSTVHHNHLVVGSLELDSAEHSVYRDGTNIKLRRKEFALLECLMQNPGDVVSRPQLSNHAWNESEEPWKNTIDVHIKYLRDKIDKPFTKKLILTVHGFGYKLDIDEQVNNIANQLTA